MGQAESVNLPGDRSNGAMASLPNKAPESTRSRRISPDNISFGTLNSSIDRRDTDKVPSANLMYLTGRSVRVRRYHQLRYIEMFDRPARYSKNY